MSQNIKSQKVQTQTNEQIQSDKQVESCKQSSVVALIQTEKEFIQ